MLMDFIGLMFVSWWIIYFLHFVVGGILDIFYDLDGSKNIKIHFK